ncbi:MAG: hypothetical protein ACI4V1_00010 [Eubacteriales bacterium]
MYHIKKLAYELEIDGGKINVILDGCAVAGLDVRSAVHQTGEDLKTIRDEEPTVPELVGTKEENGTICFTWKNKSSLWEEKTYTLECTPLRFLYKVSVRGRGKVDGVDYFTGNAAEPGHGSDYEFQWGFNPCISWYNQEDYYFKASEKCYRWSVLMVPPMFCYAFRCEGLARQLALGLAAERGEHNFNSFTYHPVPSHNWHSTFYLSTDQDGHTEVDGEWTAPHIVGYGADDEFDAMKKYSEYYVASGIAKVKKQEIPPKFWHGPIACGWIEQFARYYDKKIGPVDLACEEIYEDYVKRLHDAGLYPRCLIIDDKWQTHYAIDIANPDKFPDMRAFVDRRHAEGIHTMLWFKIFDPDGLDCDEACVTTERSGKRIDPSHPYFLKVLDDALYRIFSSDEGCYDCDGIKIDYAFQIPIGREMKTYSGKYGVELLYDFMEHIYTTAKKIKPYALINCSPCHPYFAHICDQGRLHDYDGSNRFCGEDLEFRAKMYRIAMPGTLLDTDNAGFNTRRDTMRWLLKQPQTGVPDLYCVTPLPSFGFDKDDLEALSTVWKEYTDRIDRMYGEEK